MSQKDKYYLKTIAVTLVPLTLGVWWLTPPLKLLPWPGRLGACTFAIVTTGTILVMMIRLEEMQRFKKQNQQLQRMVRTLPLALQTIFTTYRREARWREHELLAVIFLDEYCRLFLNLRPEQVIDLAERGKLACRLLSNYKYLAPPDRDFCDEALRAAVHS